MPEKNYYKILQIDPSADPEVVQAAYRRLAQKYHPDANTSSDATRWMQELNEAYEVICDPVKRAAFDRQRADRKRRRAEDQRQAEHERQQKAQATEQKRRQEEAQRSTEDQRWAEYARQQKAQAAEQKRRQEEAQRSAEQRSRRMSQRAIVFGSIVVGLIGLLLGQLFNIAIIAGCVLGIYYSVQLLPRLSEAGGTSDQVSGGFLLLSLIIFLLLVIARVVDVMFNGPIWPR